MKIYEALEQQLKKEPNFVSDNGELKKWVVLNKAQNFDEELIGMLLDNLELKNKFFVQVKGVLVFNQNLFVQFLEQKNYMNDSYTQYKNKVGLTIDGKFLKQRNEVSLVWPYKDCILEGGQSREEEKREEIFFNEILAQDEITQLLEPKVMTNAKRIDKAGEKPLNQFNRNKEGTITDNLIIKGNNLLALHTLKVEFEGKVKLIYIDPPFNTENDSFRYNDSFNHSTWLTFLKSRLEIARKLLSKDGAIFVHLDHEEAPYCKVLMDDIFGRENWLNTFSVTTNDASGFKATGKSIFSTANQLFLYAKNKPFLRMGKQYIENEYDTNYGQVLNDRAAPIERWRFEPITKVVAENLGYNSSRTAKKALGAIFDEEIAKFAFLNANRVFRTAAIQGGARQKRLETIEKSAIDRGVVFLHPNDDVPNFYILNGEGMIFYESRLIEIDGKKVAGQLLTDVWTDIKVTGIANEGGVKLKNGKKPEKLLKRVIDMVTTRNDIVLDFFVGSGSTAAVAHKMNRQYIGVEQMDYIETVTVERLKNVIAGEQGGISKSINWQGGGNFVYIELKKYNQALIEQIEAAQNTDTLLQIWEQMKAKSFLNYNVDIKKQDAHIGEFKALSSEQQKQHLCELLDKNQLYVNLSSLLDADFICTDAEKKVTKDFYQIQK